MLDYADDTTLVALIFEQLELLTNEHESACRKWGMKIIIRVKQKVISDEQARIRIDGVNIENLNHSFTLAVLYQTPLRRTALNLSLNPDFGKIARGDLEK